MAKADVLHFTGDREADELLARDPLALLIGMLLDQQVPMEWAFKSPWLLRERLGPEFLGNAGRLDAGRIAAMDPDELAAVFSQKPALHRYPGSMAKRVHTLCRHVEAEYGGRTEEIWTGAADGRDLLERLLALPGFGKEKARIFVAVLGRRLGVAPPGWEEVAADWPSVADADAPGAIERIREAKAAWKAAGKKKT